MFRGAHACRSSGQAPASLNHGALLEIDTNLRMPDGFGKLQAMVIELERQAGASVRALHTIRARTSRVLAATAAFSALADEVVSLGRRLAQPKARDTYANPADRAALQAELSLLIEQLDGYRQLYTAELALVEARKPKAKRRWWRAFY
jgi:hypothetical protein